MIKITPTIQLDENEIQENFVRASGPGGQNVNKVDTAVQLRFNVANSPSLSDPIRKRLLHLSRRRITDEGVLIIEAKRFRSQERNREDARQRLVDLIRQAAKPLKVRRKTKPTRASHEQRLQKKRHRSEIKRARQSPPQE
ncbi:MAG: aminoacyl-tRNA hydrolase [Anaerolineae bacterium]|nr:aminoacyl-tRNA hydrolase [Anaerolineae bacterium]